MAYSIKSLGFGKVAVVHNNKHIKTFNGVSAPQDARNFINNQYKSSQPGSSTGKISTHEAAADIYLNMQLDEQINEVMSNDADAAEWIKDFIESDNPKFAGKSKADRKKMALAAYYAKQRNESVELDKPQKTIEVTRKNGNTFTGTIKSTGDDYHIVKDKSGKQYTIDHSGNTIDEETSLGNESEFKVTKPGSRWKKAPKQDTAGKPEKSLEYADKETNIKEDSTFEGFDVASSENKHKALQNKLILAKARRERQGHSSESTDERRLQNQMDQIADHIRKKKTVSENVSEATVKTSNGVKTVKHGKDFSVVLHPQHQEAINKLKDEQEHKFKDETGQHWIARRKGEDVHFQSADLNGTYKTHIPASSLKEQVSEGLKFNGGIPDVDHMRGSVMRGGEGKSKVCPHCNGNRYIWTNSEHGKTPNHPWINPNTATLKSKEISCPTCDGGKKKIVSEDMTPVAPVPGQRNKDTAVMVHPETKQRVVISRKNIGNYADWKEVGPGQKLKENLSFSNMSFDGEVISESVVIDLSESKYEDYFKAMMKKAGITAISDLKTAEEKKEFMDAVDAGYKAKNESVLAEEYLRTDIEKKIEAHEKQGHKVADVKHTIRGGKPYSEFVVTTPEGNKKKYVFHGDVQRHEKLV